MKHFKRWFFICISLATGAGHAADGRFSIEAVTGMRHFSFKEYSPAGSQLVKESGWLPGAQLTAITSKNRWRAGLSARFYKGDIDYDGQTQSGAPFTGNTDEQILQLDSALAYEIYRHPTFKTALVGKMSVGVRYWDRDIKGRNNILGLNEDYRWYNAAVGFVIEHPVKSALLTFNAQLTRTINPEVDIDFESDFDDITLDLQDRYGASFLAAYKKPLTRELAFIARAGVSYWSFGRSDTDTLTAGSTPVGTVFQPKGEAREIDGLIGLNYTW